MFNDQAYFTSQFKTTYPEFAFHAETPEALASWQAAFRSRLRQTLGLNTIPTLLPADFCPQAEKLSTEDMGDFLRESWYLLVELEVRLPFYLLRPKGIKGPLPLVLTPHGHNHPNIYAGIARNEKEEASMREGERDIAVQAVQEGYIAIAPTTRGFGETRTAQDRAEDKLSSCRTLLLHDLLVGRTPIGDRVWDIERLIDWALTQPEIDGSRIAITGNSGGGTVSLFAAACDTRITVAIPASYFCTFKGSIGAMHHCDCNYIPGILLLGEMYDIAGLIAPRPFCAIAGLDDPIFPNPSVREAFEHIQKVYQVAGVPDRCRLYEGQGGHRYYKAGAWPFLKQWF